MNDMENENKVIESKAEAKSGGDSVIIASGMISIAIFVFSGVQLYVAKGSPRSGTMETAAAPVDQNLGALQEAVAPSSGVALPVTWGDLGKKMVEAGVIDEARFTALYADRGGLPPDMKELLDLSGNGRITMTPENSGILLNLFWALGLGTKSPVLETGPMQDPKYGAAGNFASTGGWTLAMGGVMTHYGAHRFVALTPDEQALVVNVAKNIYRPCCGNATYFPDCNHGMAMLGLLELMASQGASEGEMYKTALAVNSYWFPDNYLTIARYLQTKGVDWKTASPKDVLGAEYSSGAGYQKIVAAMAASVETGGVGKSGGCGV